MTYRRKSRTPSSRRPTRKTSSTTTSCGGQAQDIEDRPIRGLYAAGELVGGLFYHNYPGRAGLMAGSAFGKAAGESAAADIGAKAT